MPNWSIAMLIGGTLGLFLGRWIARGSALRKPIYGGRAAKTLHYLACAALVAAPFAGFSGSLLYSALHLVPRVLVAGALAFSYIGISGLLLIGFAVFESRRSPRPD